MMHILGNFKDQTHFQNNVKQPPEDLLLTGIYKKSFQQN